MNAPLPAAAAANDPATFDPLWYKDAVIYQLHVKAFYDSDRDGIGDFKGLTEKLDYIAQLGVNTIWLLPFYPSPMLDDGYDVANYRDVHPAYGTRRDFQSFVREAHNRNLRVITELVINHTSDQHPWFQAARRAPKGSSKRDFYVWSDDPKRYSGTRIIFTDTESSNWAWDEVAQAHYWHRFFSHQPDLNFDNPAVMRAVLGAMRFWLDMGVDGLRLDAIPYLVEREGTNNENLAETHTVIKRIRAALDARYQGRMLLAEANQWPEDVRQYFGEGDECHMAFHFPLMPRLFMALAMEDRHPVVEILSQTPDIPANCQWAIFLRNHDELTLEMVTDRERDYMYRMFADDPRMRINVGIRRRLAPLLQNNRSQIELISFVLATLPGTPILYYGDEIGMGDNIYLGDRNGVRTPMQWSPDRNAGFSHADPQRLYLPPVMDAVYGYQSVNVEAQMRSTSSLLNWTRRLLTMRSGHRAFGRGTLEFLDPGNRKIIAYLREHEGAAILCVANLSRVAQAVELDLSRFEKRVPIELMGNSAFPPVGKLPYLLTLPGCGYYAFRLAADVPAPAWHEERLPYRPLRVLVLPAGNIMSEPDDAKDMRQLLGGELGPRIRDTVLLPYLRNRRWFAAKALPVRNVRFAEIAEWRVGGRLWLLTLLDVEIDGEPTQRYFFPLGVDWEARDHDPMEKLGAWAFAKLRRRERVGIVYGAFGNPEFARAMARGMESGAEIPLEGGRLRFSSTSAYAEGADAVSGEIRVPPLDQSNTGAFFGNRLYFKGYRRLHPGTNPELEIGRFLTDVSPYSHIAPVAGAVEYADDRSGHVYTLAMLQRFQENQGDAWAYTLAYLEGALRTHQEATAGERPAEGHVAYTERIGLLARRVAELHRAFARPSGDAAFEPEPVAPGEFDAWRQAVMDDASTTLDLLGRLKLDTDPVRGILAARTRLIERISSLRCDTTDLMKTRVHGDLHLGQALVTQDDFVIIDFEGEPARPMEERRRKHSPLRDVAGILRSLDYAAHSAARTAAVTPPELGAPAPADTLRDWERRSTAAFIQAYRAAATGLASVPARDEDFDALLTLLLFEKALYELRYEANNRPDWLPIPLGGLQSLLEWTRA